jgi:integrase
LLTPRSSRQPAADCHEDIRLFQLHLAEQGVSICTRNRTMTGVAFLFRVTLRRPEIADQIEYIAEPQKIPLVLSPEEVRRLLDAAPGFKCRLLLNLAYGCGLRASEVVSLKVCDIDSAQMVIRIEQGKGRKDRYVMLSPDLLDDIRSKRTAFRVRCFQPLSHLSKAALPTVRSLKTQGILGDRFVLFSSVCAAVFQFPLNVFQTPPEVFTIHPRSRASHFRMAASVRRFWSTPLV